METILNYTDSILNKVQTTNVCVISRHPERGEKQHLPVTPTRGCAAHSTRPLSVTAKALVPAEHLGSEDRLRQGVPGRSGVAPCGCLGVHLASEPCCVKPPSVLCVGCRWWFKKFPEMPCPITQQQQRLRNPMKSRTGGGYDPHQNMPGSLHSVYLPDSYMGGPALHRC